VVWAVAVLAGVLAVMMSGAPLPPAAGELGLSSGVAHADESCLDPADPLGEAGQRKGVQKLPFLKRLRAELSVWGGFYASDLLSSSWTAGGAVAFYPFEDWGLEVSLQVTPFTLAVERPLTQFFAGQIFHKSFAYVAVADAVWAPIHFKVKASEHHIAYGDLLFYLGAGDTVNATAQGLTFDAGFGLKIYANKYFGVRFDLRDYLMVQEAVAVERVTNSLVGTFGLSLFVPHARPYSR
jgi:outer membrane beta-barrel protein